MNGTDLEALRRMAAADEDPAEACLDDVSTSCGGDEFQRYICCTKNTSVVEHQREADTWVSLAMAPSTIDRRCGTCHLYRPPKDGELSYCAFKVSEPLPMWLRDTENWPANDGIDPDSGTGCRCNGRMPHAGLRADRGDLEAFRKSFGDLPVEWVTRAVRKPVVAVKPAYTKIPASHKETLPRFFGDEDPPERRGERVCKLV